MKKYRTMIKNCINFLEKQAAVNIRVFAGHDEYNTYVYVCNEYSIIRFDSRYYRDFPEKKYFIDLQQLIDMIDTKQGIAWNKKRKETQFVDSSGLLDKIKEYDLVRDFYKSAIDTQYEKTYTAPDKIELHYFATNETLLAINRNWYDRIMDLFYLGGYAPETYGTNRKYPVVFGSCGISFYILPVFTGVSKNPIEAALYDEYKPHYHTAPGSIAI